MNQAFARRMSRGIPISLAILLLPAGCDTGTTPGGPRPGLGAIGSQPPLGTGSTSTPATQATAASTLEQLSLERINRARLRPDAEAAAGGIAIDEGIPGQLDDTPRQPLAMNATLRQAARAHSEDMLNRDYFAHDTPEGVSPFDRIQNAGYLFVTAGENLAWRGTTGRLDPVQTVETQHRDLFVDRGIEGRGHRVTMLNPHVREVGIAVVRGSFTDSGGTVFSDSIMQTQDFAANPLGSTFVLGVVYNDNNSNGLYDAGEGVAGATVTLETVARTTNEAGGYSFQINQAGSYTLRFPGGRELPLTFALSDPNIKIDFVDNRRIIVNFGLGPLE